MGSLGRIVSIRLGAQQFNELSASATQQVEDGGSWRLAFSQQHTQLKESNKLTIRSTITPSYFQGAEAVSAGHGHHPSRDVPIALSRLAAAGFVALDVKALDSAQKTIKVLVTLQDGFFTVTDRPATARTFYTHASALLEYWLAEDCQAPAAGDQGGVGTKAPWSKSILRESVFKLVSPEDWHVESEQPEGLKSRLYRYQRRALSWMKWRESFAARDATLAPCDSNSVKAHMHVVPADGWHAVNMQGCDDTNAHRCIYYSPERQEFRKEGEVPMVDFLEKVPSGGILADEMGLGKTVEIIALILANKPTRGASTSSDNNTGSLSGGTLIVCPPALLQQWQAELANHAGGSLNVVMYDGLRASIDAAKAAEELMQDDTDSSSEDEGGGQRIIQVKKRRKKESIDARYDRYTAQMIREAELYARVAAGENLPEEDARKYALDLAATLAAADVVLTSFDVLTREVHYDASNNERTMRRRKRYVIPDCPLVLVSWHRLVADEAQMVGRLSNVGYMCAKIPSKHRWCVTGTPMTSKNELADLQALLSIVECKPFCNAAVWNSMIQRPLNACTENGAEDGGSGDDYSRAAVAWDLFQKAIRPLMWRTNKGMARSETDIPARDLKVVALKLMPGEYELYKQLVDEAREASAKVASKAAEIEEHVVAASIGAGTSSAVQGQGSPSGRAQVNRGQKERNSLAKLMGEQLSSLTELRLACIHPQLTKFWKTSMHGEMQLETGGAQSMEEVLQRLVDREAVQLEEFERELCAHLNGLAMHLLGTARMAQTLAPADDGGAGPSSPTSPVADGSASGSAQKQARSSKTSGKKAASNILMAEEAVALLEDSFRVSEKGIAALGVDLDVLQDTVPEPGDSQTMSWKTWKRLQINTAAQLIGAYERIGAPPEKIGKFEEQLTKRCDELEEAANQALAIAQQKADSLVNALKAATESFSRTARDALVSDFPDDWGELVLSCAGEFYDELERTVLVEMGKEAGGSSTLGGVSIQRIYAEEEKKVQGDQARLEPWVAHEKAKAALVALQRELARLDDTNVPAGDIHRELRLRMKAWVDLLPRFRRDTILNMHARVLPIPRRMAKFEGQDAGVLHDTASVDYEIREALFEDSLDYYTTTADQGLVHGATRGIEFIPSSQCKGYLPGYVFKMGDAGRLGYHKDCPPEVEVGGGGEVERRREKLPLVAQIQECGVAVVRGLNELKNRSQRLIKAEDVATFTSCGIEAVEKRLNCSLRQTELIKAARDVRKAEQAVVAKQALKDEAYEEAQSAKTECPIRLAGHSRDWLRQEIELIKVNAQRLRAKRSFMANRITETTTIPETECIASGSGSGSGSGSQHMHHAAEDADAVMAAAPAQDTLGPELLEARRPGMECPVCLNDIVGDIWLWTGCGHAYCVDCSLELGSQVKDPHCAVCRTKNLRNQIIRIPARKPNHLQSTAAEWDPSAETCPVLKSITLMGEWSIKIKALLRRIMALATTCPEEKCLVFSQFPTALRAVGAALQNEGIGFEELSGGKKGMKKAIQGFLGDDSKRVFLLSLQAGAQGLTLVRANHVFLLEPALDPAIEQQAIARVHRIGQMRPVHVVRLLVEGTIEEEVLAIQRSRQALFHEEERENGAVEMVEDEEDVEAATTVATRVQNEVMGEGDVGRLLNAVLMG